jgi:hypothetical protein
MVVTENLSSDLEPGHVDHQGDILESLVLALRVAICTSPAYDGLCAQDGADHLRRGRDDTGPRFFPLRSEFSLNFFIGWSPLEGWNRMACPHYPFG